jgi:tetratricopeptide (TPR) repeat protein
MVDPMKHLRRIAAALLVTCAASSAYAQDVQKLSSNVDTYQGQVEDLRTRYMEPALLRSKYKLEARFNDAKVAHLLKDYRRAAVLFVDVVDDEKFRSFSTYREALFLLGDSLHQLRNYRAARRYLDMLINMGPGQYYEEAAGKLLQIAFDTRNFSEADRIYALLNNSGSMNPALAYIAGKALYEKESYDKARESFQRALVDPEYKIVGQYYIGVTHAAEGNFDAARTAFQAIVSNPTAVNPRDEEVIDLAYIALGRVAYEVGDLDLAIDYYARPPRNSPHFDRALWEMTWVLIAEKNYQAAKRNVEIFLMEDPDPAFEPDARILLADLSLRLGEYEEAKADYQELLDRFRPVKGEIDEFVAQQQDLPAFFGTVVEDELRGVEPDFMPPLVAKYVADTPTMKATKRVLSDVRAVSVDVDDSLRMLDEISARLNSSTRIQSFPVLADGMSRGIELDSRIVQTRRDLIAAEYRALEPALSPAEKQEWQSRVTALEALAQKVESAPRTADELSKREEVVIGEFDRLRRTIDEVGYQIDSYKAQLAAFEAYVKNQYGRPLSESEKAELEAERKQIQQTLAELERIKVEIQREIDYAREEVGVGDAVNEAESAQRRRFRAQLADARDWLAQRRSKAPGSARAELDRIDAVRRKLPAVEARLEGYFETMNELVEERVVELRDEVAVERDLVENHRQSIRELITNAQTGAGVIAYLNFMRTRAQFDEIILRGEVGLTDVSWQRKADMTEKINDLFEQRTLQLKDLEASFEEVR